MKASKRLSLLCGGLLVCAAGCVLPGEGSRVVTIRPDHRYIDYVQDFQEAYAAPAADGGFDLVLANGIFAESQSHGARLYPASAVAVSQAVIIHVAWRPTAAASGDYPAAANSTVDWYVFDNRPDGGCSQYQGTGFVRVNLSEKRTLFVLRDVQIKPTVSAPSMRDPLGPSHLTGTIQAQNNFPRAKAVIDEIARRRQIQTSTPTATTSSAPASEPAGTPPARNIQP